MLQNGTIPLILKTGKIQNMFCKKFNSEYTLKLL